MICLSFQTTMSKGGGGGSRSSSGHKEGRAKRSFAHGYAGAGKSFAVSKAGPSSSVGKIAKSSDSNFLHASASKSLSSSSTKASSLKSNAKSMQNKSPSAFNSPSKAKPVTTVKPNVFQSKQFFSPPEKRLPVASKYFPRRTRASSPSSFITRPSRARVIKREKQRLPASEYNRSFPQDGLRTLSSLDSLPSKNCRYTSKVRPASRSRSRRGRRNSDEVDNLDDYGNGEEEEVNLLAKPNTESIATSKMFLSPESKPATLVANSLKSSPKESEVLQTSLACKHSLGLKDAAAIKPNAKSSYSLSHSSTVGSTTGSNVAAAITVPAPSSASAFRIPKGLNSRLSFDDVSTRQPKTFIPFKISTNVASNELKTSSTGLTNCSESALIDNFPQFSLTCRICLESMPQNQMPSPNSEQRLVSPCRCRGQSKYVHLFCLREWLMVSRSLICQVCHSRIRNVRVSVPNFGNWLFHEFAHLSVLFMFLAPLIFDVVYSVRFKCSWLSAGKNDPIFNLFTSDHSNSMDSTNQVTFENKTVHASAPTIYNTQLAFQLALYSFFKIRLQLQLFSLLFIVYGLPCTLIISAPAFICFLKYCKQRMRVYQRENQQFFLPSARDWQDE